MVSPKCASVKGAPKCNSAASAMRSARKIDNMANRIAVTEQSSTNTASSIKGLQTILSQQAGI